MTTSSNEVIVVEDAYLLSDWASVWTPAGGWLEASRTYNSETSLDRAFQERPIQRWDGALFVGYNNSYRNHYHLLLEWLPAIWEFSALPPSSGVRLVLPRQFAALIPLRLLLDQLHLLDRTLWIDGSAQGPTLHAPELHYSRYLSSMNNYHYGGAAAECHEFMMRNLAPPILPFTPDRIYISRADSTRRTLVNELAFRSHLEGGWGFRTVTLTGATFAYQVRMLALARYIVGDHGAGLANLVFRDASLRPQRGVVEVRPETYPNPCFETICETRGDDYALVSSTIVGQNHGWNDSTYSVDLGSVDSALAEIGCRQSGLRDSH